MGQVTLKCYQKKNPKEVMPIEKIQRRKYELHSSICCLMMTDLVAVERL